MIDYIHGELAELTSAYAVVEAGGVGYGLNISLTTYDALNGGKVVKLFVYENIHEDSYVLYGFASKDERAMFEALISVSGVGGNTARTILSAFSPDEFRTVVANEDSGALKSVKGIGLKTSQRIIVDLKDKLGKSGALSVGVTGGSVGDGRQESAIEAVGALTALGFPSAAAQKAVNAVLKLDEDDATAEKIIKMALKML